MSRHKCALSALRIDRLWPHQMALVDEACTGTAFDRHRAFCAGRSLAPRTQRPIGYRVFYFADPDDAAAFRAAFGREPFDPATCRGNRQRDFWT